MKTLKKLIGIILVGVICVGGFAIFGASFEKRFEKYDINVEKLEETVKDIAKACDKASEKAKEAAGEISEELMEKITSNKREIDALREEIENIKKNEAYGELLTSYEKVEELQEKLGVEIVETP